MARCGRREVLPHSARALPALQRVRLSLLGAPAPGPTDDPRRPLSPDERDELEAALVRRRGRATAGNLIGLLLLGLILLCGAPMVSNLARTEPEVLIAFAVLVALPFGLLIVLAVRRLRLRPLERDQKKGFVERDAGGVERLASGRPWADEAGPARWRFD